MESKNLVSEEKIGKRRSGRGSQSSHLLGPRQSGKGFEFYFKCSGKLSESFKPKLNLCDVNCKKYYNITLMFAEWIVWGKNWMTGSQFSWLSH